MDVRVEVKGKEILVSLPGTSYSVVYQRPAGTKGQLLTKCYSGRELPGAPLKQSDFAGRAWRAANAKARELGWIA
jgi:hypothetical protein